MEKMVLVEAEKRILQEFENFKFLNGEMKKEERYQYLKEIDVKTEVKAAYAALMRIQISTLERHRITEVIHFALTRNNTKEKLQIYYLGSSHLLLLLYLPKQLLSSKEWFSNLQHDLKVQMGICSFITVSNCFTDLTELPEIYQTIEKMQRYLLIDGYGSCIDETDILNRTYTNIIVNKEELVYFVLQKDISAINQYLEELLINNIQKSASIGVICEIIIRLALILEEIRLEYNLPEKGRQLFDTVEKIHKAENVDLIKTIFLSEITELVSRIDTENIQYSPVVRQIAAEVKNDYQNNMNLKTLASKYHMNTSYLGQIFQKEIGCPFSQYLNNVRNDVAKNLLLTTNMRISDIAHKVGYSNTSYFYRKFKQSYGVSPMELRNTKNY